jgi:hypothetical protein
LLISHLHRFIYLKTVKTGGTAVEIYFEVYCGDPAQSGDIPHFREAGVSAWGVIGTRGAATGAWYNHMPASRIRERMGEADWNDYFKFCVVRNPFDRVVSQFWFQLEAAAREELRQADFAAVRKAFAGWSRQLRFPVDSMIYRIDGQPGIDYFIRYERLHEGLEEVCRRLNVPWQPERLGRYKSGFRVRPEHFLEYYNSRVTALVRAEFAWELDFGLTEVP